MLKIPGVPSIEFGRIQMFWVMVIICQVMFWYMALPGPQLANGYVGSLQAGISTALWSTIFLLVLPWIYWSASGGSLSGLGLGLGDWKFGLVALAILVPPVSVGVWLGTGNQEICDFYPIVGNQLSVTGDWTVWFLWYGLFYIAFEFFYRGILVHGPNEWPESTRVSLAIVCCTLIHVGKPLIETAASLPGSVLFIYLALRTRSIWYGVVLHWLIGIVNDLGAVAATG